MNEAEREVEARALRRSIARIGRSFRGTRNADSPTPAQLSALGTLHRNGQMATGELAGFERLKPQSVTRLVAELADRGLIERIADETDRRRVLVGVTAEGQRQLVLEMRRRDIRLNRQLSRLTADEFTLLKAARVVIDRLADVDETDDADASDCSTSPLPEISMTPDGRSRLEIVRARLRDSQFRDVDLSNTAFRDVNLAGAMFGDVNLSNAAFEDVRLRTARFADVDFSGATIDTSDLTGMRINGVLVSDLFDAYRSVQK